MFGRKKREAQRQRAAEEVAKVAEEAERERALVDLFDRAEQGDHEAQEMIMNSRRWSRNAYYWPQTVKSRYSNVSDLYWSHWRTTRVSELLEAWRAAADAASELEALKNLFLFRNDKHNNVNEAERDRLEKELHIKWADLERRLQEVAQAHYEELLAERENLKGFKKLWKFIVMTRRTHTRSGTWDNDLRKAGVKDFPYPENWNDLLACHYDTPAIGAFKGLPDRGPGDVRLLADQAVESNSFTDAQIALAYCNAEARFREAVGDVLTAQLARVVNRQRIEAPQVEAKEHAAG